MITRGEAWTKRSRQIIWLSSIVTTYITPFVGYVTFSSDVIFAQLAISITKYVNTLHHMHPLSPTSSSGTTSMHRMYMRNTLDVLPFTILTADAKVARLAGPVAVGAEWAEECGGAFGHAVGCDRTETR